jgi:3-hexulose-6-phosphate synthase/6-phospho-3-hexuloisomerase
MLEEFYSNAQEVFQKFDEKELERAVSTILGSKKIFVLGIGHSGMFGKIFSMKLNHVGLRAYSVFDEINPPFEKEDLFIAISQSGETKTILALAEKAKKIGGKVLAVTSVRDSTLGSLSESVLEIEKFADTTRFEVLALIGDRKNQNLLGALFGFNIYILFYTIIVLLAQKLGESPDSIDKRHANLQ